MFKRAFFAFFALIIIALFATYYLEIRLRPEDSHSFTKLVQESLDLRTQKAFQQEPAHQIREGVQKDIWTEHHFQIQSDYSDLLLSQNKDKIEAIEKLKNIRCTIGDGITLTAEEGFYALSSQQFVAEKNCLLTQNENRIEGTHIELDFEQETVTYENPKGFIAPLHFSAKKLIWNKKKDQIYLTDFVTIEKPGEFVLHSHHGTLTLEAFEPKLLFLEGNVRLISSYIEEKESFAIADTLTYNPQDQTLLFSSDRKVLFWQEGLNISASQILIREDRTIESKGDVHFTFDLEEQNYIDELFGKFL